MSHLSRILRGDQTGILRGVVALVRDFILLQLLGGHSPQERGELIDRANALKALVDSDGDGIPDAIDPTPHGPGTVAATPIVDRFPQPPQP